MDQLLRELDKLEQQEFFIHMADHLSSEDYRLLDEIHAQKKAIIAKLEKGGDQDGR